MKRFGDLFGQIYTFDNLLSAFYRARKGKRNNPRIGDFEANFEWELLRLSQELKEQTYLPGPYKTFMIHEPKERMISAAPFRDRVVHHALCSVIEPYFEKVFIFDSYANRSGKGTHRAIKRYQYYAKQYDYVLKCDIKKFFPSIDHQILKQELRRKIACSKTLDLIDKIIDNSNPQQPHLVWFDGDDLFVPNQRRRGLPIGNLTSQFWANVYLNRFDHFVKENLRVPGYVRYVDDFVLFGNSKEELWKWKVEIECFLEELRLVLHKNKSHVHKVLDGVPFLGFFVKPNFRIVKKKNAKRHFRYLRSQVKKVRAAEISSDQLEASLNSWLGHARFGHSSWMENKIQLFVRKEQINLVRYVNNSWRIL